MGLLTWLVMPSLKTEDVLEVFKKCVTDVYKIELDDQRVLQETISDNRGSFTRAVFKLSSLPVIQFDNTVFASSIEMYGYRYFPTEGPPWDRYDPSTSAEIRVMDKNNRMILRVAGSTQDEMYNKFVVLLKTPATAQQTVSPEKPPTLRPIPPFPPSLDSGSGSGKVIQLLEQILALCEKIDANVAKK